MIEKCCNIFCRIVRFCILRSPAILSLTVVVICIVLVCDFSVQARQNRFVKALRLTQTHFYWGDMETTVSMRALRITNRGSMKFNLVARYPDWNVTLYRSDDKVMIKKEFNKLISEGLVSSLLLGKKDRFTDRGLSEREFKFGPVKVRHVESPNMTMDFLPLKGVGDEAVEAILYSVFRVPTNGGIPIRYTKSQKGIDWMTGLDTTGARKVFLGTKTISSVIVPDIFFDLPNNYKESRVMQQVLMSKQTRESSGDMDVLLDSSRINRKSTRR